MYKLVASIILNWFPWARIREGIHGGNINLFGAIKQTQKNAFVVEKRVHFGINKRLSEYDKSKFDFVEGILFLFSARGVS